MTEQYQDSPEKESRAAVADYLRIEGWQGLDGASFEQMASLAERCSYPDALDRDSQLHAGWLHAETAIALHGVTYNTEARDAVAVEAYFDQAVSIFKNLLLAPAANRLQRSKARLAIGAMPIYKGMCYLDAGTQEEFEHYAHAVVPEAAKEALAHYDKFGNVQDISYLQLLAAMSACHSTKNMRYLILPGASRYAATQGGDNIYHWHGLCFDQQSGRISRLRIGAEGRPGYVVVPPAQLESGGRGADPAGALRLMLGKAIVLDSQRRIFRQQVHDCITRQTEEGQQPVSQTPESTVDPLAWYYALPPRQNPAEANLPLLRAGINAMEISHAAQELEPGGMLHLAEMRAEYAVYSARWSEETGDSLRDIGLEFDRAQDLLAEAALALKAKGEIVGYCRAMVAAASMPLQKAVGTERQEFNDERPLYIEALREAASLLLAEPANAVTDQLLRQLTVCLVMTGDESGSYLAVPSTPRQAGNDSVRGWDVTVWPQGMQGFRVGYTGRLRIGPHDDLSSLQQAIATVTPQMLGDSTHGGLHRVLRQDLAQPADAVMKRGDLWDAVFDRLVRAAEVADL